MVSLTDLLQGGGECFSSQVILVGLPCSATSQSCTLSAPKALKTGSSSRILKALKAVANPSLGLMPILSRRVNSEAVVNRPRNGAARSMQASCSEPKSGVVESGFFSLWHKTPAQDVFSQCGCPAGPTDRTSPDT